MEDKPSTEQKLKDWEEFFEELQNESQRGGVIVGAAFLDEQLAELLRCLFIEDKKVVDDLINSGYSPLGSFGTRITTAYCLGLIGKNDFHDLKIVKKIRNNLLTVSMDFLLKMR
jgi:DNA-binding MltR family transcriptional regulator